MEYQPLKRITLPFIVSCVYIFLYIPVLVLAIYSFNAGLFPDVWQGFSLKWYKELFQSEHIWDALLNSLYVSLSATTLSVLMALGLVYYHIKTNILSKALALFYGNIVIPEIVLAVGLLSALSFFSIPMGLPTLIVAHTVLGLGYSVPLIYNQYKGLDRRLIEASLDLGASQKQTFFKVILPLLVPAIIASGLLIFIISFDDFILSFFCAGSSAQTLPLYIFTSIRSGVSPVVNALATILLLFSGLLVFLYCSVKAKLQDS